MTPAEYAALCAKAETLGTTPAQWLRQAALARRLPPPPVTAINREEYAELARLANSGQAVVADALLEQLISEVSRLRQALLGLDSDDR